MVQFRGMSALAVAVLAFLLSVAVAPTSATTFSMQLPRYGSECFYETLNRGDRLDISYEVMGGSGSELDIDFVINNPDGSPLHVVSRERDAQFGFNSVADGQYKMCFNNLRSGAEKFVSFSITGPEDHKLVQAKTATTDDDQLEISRAVQLLADNVRFMRDEQAYLMRRQKRHRATAESTNFRVFWWSLAQTGLLIAVCAFQVMYLRRFFETRRVV
ncbi:emp24/gp25L/p24 family/GOLD-domain-containing protein [Entophlyctis helioformis]|nr:emp24/gp25L/p24 family/GOLD-domain-containing protein [Entophlyctis helioformis]